MKSTFPENYARRQPFYTISACPIKIVSNKLRIGHFMGNNTTVSHSPAAHCGLHILYLHGKRQWRWRHRSQRPRQPGLRFQPRLRKQSWINRCSQPVQLRTAIVVSQWAGRKTLRQDDVLRCSTERKREGSWPRTFLSGEYLEISDDLQSNDDFVGSAKRLTVCHGWVSFTFAATYYDMWKLSYNHSA